MSMNHLQASDTENERQTYINFLRSGTLVGSRSTSKKRLEEQLKMTPLFSWSTKEAALAKSLGEFTQYALLGHVIPMPFDETTEKSLDSSTNQSAERSQGQSTDFLSKEPNGVPINGPERELTDEVIKSDIDPVLLNTDTPWSAFICGSQGSGKSHTMSCILENCLLQNRRIGKLRKPLAGLVFHFDSMDSSHCEAAHLCSQGIPVHVLVPPSNFETLKKKYASIPGAENHIKVQEFYLQDEHFNTERIKRLMAFSDDSEHPPLYLHTLLKTLRGMALESKGASNFKYSAFKQRLGAEGFSDKQTSPLQLRLDILESFMEKDHNGNLIVKPTSASNNVLAGTSGMLTIVDLTDPTIDGNTACVLFDIALAIFLEKTECGRVIGLDEAHNYLHNGAASENFTNNLLKAVREQRHRAARVVVATQEPTVSPKFLDLCSMTFVHGFNSPEWFGMLKAHLGGASGACADFEKEGRRFMDEIIELDTGESFLFSRSALLDVKEGNPVKLGAKVKKFRTRQRLTHDGGRSQNATEQTETGVIPSSFEEAQMEEK